MTTKKPKEQSLHELFVTELADTYDSEKQLIKALPAMAAAAQDAKLKAAFTGHLAETKGQVAVLEEVFALLDLKPRGKHCDGIAGIIEEGKGAIEEIAASPVRDSALAAGGRRAALSPGRGTRRQRAVPPRSAPGSAGPAAGAP
jgi:ferritin-like metal-binding protein YciE